MADLNLSQSIFYTSYLSQHNLDPNNYATVNKWSSEVYAKKIYENNKIIYQILSVNNKIFNPFSIYGKNKSKSLFDNKEEKFIKVSERVFEMYLKFLNSQNMSLLHNVQREVSL